MFSRPPCPAVGWPGYSKSHSGMMANPPLASLVVNKSRGARWTMRWRPGKMGSWRRLPLPSRLHDFRLSRAACGWLAHYNASAAQSNHLRHGQLRSSGHTRRCGTRSPALSCCLSLLHVCECLPGMQSPSSLVPSAVCYPYYGAVPVYTEMTRLCWRRRTGCVTVMSNAIEESPHRATRQPRPPRSDCVVGEDGT